MWAGCVVMTMKAPITPFIIQLSMSVAMDILKLFQFKPANEVAMTSDLVAVFRMVSICTASCMVCVHTNLHVSNANISSLLNTHAHHIHVSFHLIIIMCYWCILCIHCAHSQFGANFNPVYQCYAINYERKRLYRHKLLSQPGYKKYLEVRVHCYGNWCIANKVAENVPA